MSIDFKGLIQKFIDKNKAVAWIPCDGIDICINDYQRDTNRYHWHMAADEFDITHKTLGLWSYVFICGEHCKTLTYKDTDCIGCQYCGKYGFKCNYDDECYRDNKSVPCKMRIVVIFNKEGSEKIKDMTNQQIKDYLVEKGIIGIKDKKYWLTNDST